MTQEEKELLLKDLCARLPYRIFVKENREYLDDSPTIYTFDYHPCIDNCKPYLRPMSNMTEEEKLQLIHYAIIGDGHIAGVDFVDWVERKNVPSYIDWLNKHHFDYRGLIDKELALEAPKDMYK